MGVLSAAGGELGDEWRAQFWATRATVLDQEQRQSAQGIEVGAVCDRTPLTLRSDKAGAGQNAQMRRHRILGNVEQPGDLARRQAAGFVSDQETKHFQPRRLSERSQRRNG